MLKSDLPTCTYLSLLRHPVLDVIVLVLQLLVTLLGRGGGRKGGARNDRGRLASKLAQKAGWKGRMKVDTALPETGRERMRNIEQSRQETGVTGEWTPA